MNKLLKPLCNFRFQSNLHENVKLIYCNNVRRISYTPKFNTKVYMAYENKYAYTIMQNNGYVINLNKETVSEPLTKEQFDKLIQENWSEKSPQLIFEMFPRLGAYSSVNKLCISNDIFDKYVDDLTDNIKFATDDELKSLFYSLKVWPETISVRTRNFVEVVVALDDECLKRFQNWTPDEQLCFVSLFYMINVTKFSDFSVRCLNKFATKAKYITPNQLIKILFFTGVFEIQPFDMHKLEVRLEECFSEFSIDELAIISMGFTKSSTPIRRLELVTKIIDKVIVSSGDVHEASLSALLKLIRSSSKLLDSDVTYKLLDVLQHQIPRLSIVCNKHVALLGMSNLTFHKNCLNKIAEKTLTCLSETRVKDLQAILLAFSTFNMIPQTKEFFLENIIKEFRKPERQKEIDLNGKDFARCVSNLATLGHHPADLINKVLDPKLLRKSYRTPYIYGKEVLDIHNTAEIFCSDFQMNLLDRKTTVLLGRKYTSYIPSASYTKKQYNYTEQMFIDIVDILKDHLGCDFVTAGHMLTHHERGDIFLCRSNDGLHLPVDDFFNKKNFGVIRKPPDANFWIVLILSGKYGTISNCNTATGPFHMKLREFSALGYCVEVVVWNIYSNLKTKEEKWNYLNSLIEQAIVNRDNKCK